MPLIALLLLCNSIHRVDVKGFRFEYHPSILVCKPDTGVFGNQSDRSGSPRQPYPDGNAMDMWKILGMRDSALAFILGIIYQMHKPLISSMIKKQLYITRRILERDGPQMLGVHFLQHPKRQFPEDGCIRGKIRAK